MEKSKRLVEIDIYRGIAIILVILSHLTFENQIQRIIIHSFNMPVFFIISGYLWKKTNIKKILKNYLLPTYIVLIFDLVKYLIKMKFALNLKDVLQGIFLIGGFFGNAPLWFLPVLACLCIIMNCLHNKKSVNYFTVILCVVCIGILKIKINEQLYFWPMAILYSYPFYFIGYVIKQNKIVINKNIWYFIAVTILLIILAYYNGYVSIIQQVFGKSYFLFLITGVLGAYFLIYVSFILKRYKKCDILSNLGINSIYILLTHYYLCRSIIPKILNLMKIQQIEYNLLFQICATLIISFGYYCFFKLFERKFSHE